MKIKIINEIIKKLSMFVKDTHNNKFFVIYIVLSLLIKWQNEKLLIL